VKSLIIKEQKRRFKMKAVILATGRGSRMGLLTNRIPKPLLEVCGKSLIARALDALPLCITECIVNDKDYLGAFYGRVAITYVNQEFPGTGGALRLA
jgi:NDP-sugar pyrophosphorylase family protein